MKIFKYIVVLWILITFKVHSQICTSTLIGGAYSFPFFQSNNQRHYSSFENLRNRFGFSIKLKEEIEIMSKFSCRFGFELVGTKVSFQALAGTENNVTFQKYDDEIYSHKLTIYELHVPIEIKFNLFTLKSILCYGNIGIGYRKNLYSKGKLFSLNNTSSPKYTDNLRIAIRNFDDYLKRDLPRFLTPKACLGAEIFKKDQKFGFFCELEYSYIPGYYQYSGSKNLNWYNDEGVFNNHLLEVVIGVQIKQNKK